MSLTDLEAYVLKTLQLRNRAEHKANSWMPLIFVMDDDLQLNKARRRNKAIFKLLHKARGISDKMLDEISKLPFPPAFLNLAVDELTYFARIFSMHWNKAAIPCNHKSCYGCNNITKLRKAYSESTRA